MTLTQSYEENRNLLTGMTYHRGTTLVAQREYVYDTLGRPTARNTARKGTVVNDSFTHNSRSELMAAQVNGEDHQYNYDNIGNRTTAMEGDESTAYTANALNQYTTIQENEEASFTPLFDADGNQTRIKTETGIWEVIYNAENRPVSFTNKESNTVVECAYDSMGRRAYKKVTVDGAVTLHQRYIYRGYLQIAALDLTRSNHPALWFITWDPTQPIATRPLSIRINGTWYTYGWDLTKNICELYSTGGGIATTYTYTPFGKGTSSGNITQPIQWSSEYTDNELGMVYYNYRHYNLLDGRWFGRDKIEVYNLYCYIKNNTLNSVDIIGMMCENENRTEVNYENYSDYFLEVDNKNRQVDSFLLINNNDSLQAPYYNKYVYESLLKAAQKERKDKQGRECYIIDIYRKALSLRGIISLPWKGYDEAILITHSEYVNNEISYIDSGVSVPGSNQNIYIQVSSLKNVHTYGCHLSGKQGGCVQVADVLNMILDYLNNLKVGECCLKATRIQIVSARLTNVPISL